MPVSASFSNQSADSREGGRPRDSCSERKNIQVQWRREGRDGDDGVLWGGETERGHREMDSFSLQAPAWLIYAVTFRLQFFCVVTGACSEYEALIRSRRRWNVSANCSVASINQQHTDLQLQLFSLDLKRIFNYWHLRLVDLDQLHMWDAFLTHRLMSDIQFEVADDARWTRTINDQAIRSTSGASDSWMCRFTIRCNSKNAWFTLINHKMRPSPSLSAV